MKLDPLRNYLHQEIEKIRCENGISYREALLLLKRRAEEQELAEKFSFDPQRVSVHREILRLSREKKISYREALNILRKRSPHLF